MINFPVLNRLEVQGYDLYPGASDSPGLHVDLGVSTSVILGANGLGKSTLIEIMFRMLTGPFDIPKLSASDGLGNANLVAAPISTTGKNYFGNRVTDGARGSDATLRFELGTDSIEIVRSLSDMSLLSVSVGGVDAEPSEPLFQEMVRKAAGLGTFADWILVLRFVTFYMDDRRALIWDRAAQRQLLRPLFLSNDDAQLWTTQERAILELDSRRRNLNVALNREERVMEQEGAHNLAPNELRLEVTTLQERIAADIVSREEAETEQAARQEHLSKRRLEALRVELAVDTAKRQFEHAKLASLSSRFPANESSARYLFGNFLSSGDCLVCGHEAHQLRETFENRLQQNSCAFCGTPHHVETDENVSDITDARAYTTESEFLVAASKLEIIRQSVAQTLESLESVELRLAELDSRIRRDQNRSRTLIKLLPQSEQEGTEASGGLATLRARVRGMNDDLARKAAEFRTFVDEQKSVIYDQASELEETFGRYSHEFLFENAQLSRTEREEKLGQSAFKVSFPAYELELANSGSDLLEIRSASDEVSESQKEFVDLAFRMSLIAIAGIGGRGTIVIDTPESSLDAVFAERAALVLARFASDNRGSRLVLASNFTQSSLIPDLLEAVTNDGNSLHVTDLRKFARGTAATVALSEKYDRALEAMAGAYV